MMRPATLDALVVEALVSPFAIETGSPLARVKRDVTRELDRQIYRACWRAERRGRGKPLWVRQGARWVYSQRRMIAYELIRALRALGAGPELANAVAARACERFPRDGVVHADAPDRPRARGDAPRQVGTNPRARGSSPRQRGDSPRQKRAAADLSQNETADASLRRPIAPPTGVEPEQPSTLLSAAPGTSAYLESLSRSGESNTPPPLEQLAPGWHALKAKMFDELEPHERERARKAARADRTRLEGKQRSQNPSPSNH